MVTRAQRSLVSCALPALEERPQLRLPADENAGVPPFDFFAHGGESVGGHALRFPLQLERLDCVDLGRVADECERLGAEQDLAWLRGLLEPGGDVDRIAGRQALLGAGHHLARVQPDPRLQAELGQGITHLHRRSAGPEGVVLVQLWDAEHGHDRVADELLHRSAVGFDDPLHPLEVAGEERTQGFRIGGLPKRGRAGDVAEEDGDGLALLARRLGRRQRSGTVRAESEVPVALAPTVGADRHISSLDLLEMKTRATLPSGCPAPYKSVLCIRASHVPFCVASPHRSLSRAGRTSGRTWDRTRDLPRVKRALSR